MKLPFMGVEYEEIEEDGEQLVEVRQNGKAWIFQVLDENRLGAPTAGGSLSDEDLQKLPDEVIEKLEEEGWEDVSM